MLSSAPARMLDHIAYRFERTQSWSSGCPATSMSLPHRSDHAAECPASTLSKPFPAAAVEASSAEVSGRADVSVVSAPTNFESWYVAPALTGKRTVSETVSPCAFV